MYTVHTSYIHIYHLAYGEVGSELEGGVGTVLKQCHVVVGEIKMILYLCVCVCVVSGRCVWWEYVLCAWVWCGACCAYVLRVFGAFSCVFMCVCVGGCVLCVVCCVCVRA